RPLVRFMVEVTDPRLGETVLDPASGTGGFLVEAFNHLSKQVKNVADRRTLQEKSLMGCEPKPLPYLLCQMNLLLHGLDAPHIDPGNSLRFKLSEIGEKDRVDVIVTNPPFGGEEEKGVQGNFPEDRQTSETALLFLQLIMRKLHRNPTLAGRPARAAVVVPNGTLFGDGVCARIKDELLKEFNLHTVVRLPNGVFAPYTGIPTNILFFDRSGPTRDVWYYEHRCPTAGRITPKPPPSSSRNSRHWFPGGASAKKMSTLGKFPWPNCSSTTVISTARTHTPTKTLHTCLPRNSPSTSSRKSNVSRKSWATSINFSQSRNRDAATYLQADQFRIARSRSGISVV